MFLANLPRAVYEPWLVSRGEEVEYIDLPYLCLLVNTGRERILIDTGNGRAAPETPGRLRELLRAQGLDPGSISTVILSHAHGDHIEGCLDEQGRPAFPNARYVLSRAEWDYWTNQPSMHDLPVDQAFKDAMLESALRNLSGLRAVIDLAPPDAEVVPGVTLTPAYGHSPGHVAVRVESAGQELLFLADAVVHPLHVEYPDTLGVTDHEPVATVATRRRLLEYASKQGCMTGTSHFPFPGLGRIVANGATWEWRAETRGAPGIEDGSVDSA
jgi:glyoxylase-like metal-dependent hydrolase (beta-lactamase superfamily II)